MSEREVYRPSIFTGTLVAAGLLLGACSINADNTDPQATGPVPTASPESTIGHSSSEDERYFVEALKGDRPVTMFQGVYLVTPLGEEDDKTMMVTFSPMTRTDNDPAEDIPMVCVTDYGVAMVFDLAQSSMIVDNKYAGEDLIEGFVQNVDGGISVTDGNTGRVQDHWCEIRSGTRAEVEQQILDELNLVPALAA